jgi:hypothetical protein
MARSESPFASAQWIWDGGEPAPVDAYRLFRRSFALKRVPPRATGSPLMNSR